MKQGTTLFGLVSLIMLAVFGAAGYFVKAAFDAEKGKAQIEVVLSETRDAVADLRDKVAEIEKERLAALDAVASANMQADQLAARLREYEANLHSTQADLRRATNQLAIESTIQQSLNQKIKEMDTARRAAEQQMVEYRQKLEALSKQVPIGATNAVKENPFIGAYLALNLSPDEIRQRLEELDRLRANPTLTKPQTPVTVTGSATNTPAPAAAAAIAKGGAAGQIRAINAEFSFVILDVGAPHGVKVDDEFAVLRGNETIGRIKVKRLYQGLSVCDLLNEQSAAAFRIGDRVEQIKPHTP